MTSSSEEPREHLSDVANVYVTAKAARDYANARGVPEETGRRELTVLMLGAYKTSNGGWRRRIQSQKIDVSAQVSIEGELAVITAVQAKVYLGGAQQRRARTYVVYPKGEESITLQTVRADEASAWRAAPEPSEEVKALRARVAELEAQLHRGEGR